MIRKLLNGDIDRIADICLNTNLKAHYFISNQYWKHREISWYNHLRQSSDNYSALNSISDILYS